MAVRFSDSQVCQATGAKKTRSGGRASFDAVCTDSRQITKGCLFVALRGEKFDAHDFLSQAVDAPFGAAARSARGFADIGVGPPLDADGRAGPVPAQERHVVTQGQQLFTDRAQQSGTVTVRKIRPPD